MADPFPFILNVSTCLQGGMPEQFRKIGDSPVRVSAEMIDTAEGEETAADDIVTNLGDGVVVDAIVITRATGECVRYLAPLNPELSFHISAVFSNSEDFTTGDDAEEEDAEDEVDQIVDNTVDITQTVIGETGSSLSFSPTYLDFGSNCAEPDSKVFEPDGTPGEEERIDSRWAGLVEKFGSLGDDE